MFPPVRRKVRLMSRVYECKTMDTPHAIDYLQRSIEKLETRSRDISGAEKVRNHARLFTLKRNLKLISEIRDRAERGEYERSFFPCKVSIR